MRISNLMFMASMLMIGAWLSASCGNNKNTAPNESTDSTATGKTVITWYIYHEGENSFDKDIKPLKGLVSSLSVFGKAPKSLIEECHSNGIEVYRAVNGSETDVNTREKADSLVNSYLKTCEEFGYDGIDLDLEHLDPGIKEAYTYFLNTASEKLHAAGKKLSHCVGYYYPQVRDENTKTFYDPAVLANTCDLVRVMCYDMYWAYGPNHPELTGEDCTGVGPTADYPWVKDVMNYWMKRIPKDKLVMSLPAYANDYTVTGKAKGNQVYYSVPQDVKGDLPSPKWLYYEKMNIYLYDGMDDQKHVFFASDAKSTAHLLKLADEIGICRIGFWHLGSVDPSMWDVTRQWQKGTLE